MLCNTLDLAILPTHSQEDHYFYKILHTARRRDWFWIAGKARKIMSFSHSSLVWLCRDYFSSSCYRTTIIAFLVNFTTCISKTTTTKNRLFFVHEKQAHYLQLLPETQAIASLIPTCICYAHRHPTLNCLPIANSANLLLIINHYLLISHASKHQGKVVFTPLW